MAAEHLYVHVPFCARRCVYCDFSIAVRSRVPVDDYLRAVEKECDARYRGGAPDLRTVYLGGGTPSKLGGPGIHRLLDAVRTGANVRTDAEVTLEMNPEDVTPEAAAAWRLAGVNRASLGVQSFDDTVLRWMHRTHDSATARNAIHVLRDTGIDNISIDLIFALPRTVQRDWRRDLDLALELGLPHVSAYGLTVEPHTPLGRWVARSEVVESPDEVFEREFLDAHEILTRAGYGHYEVSNFARPGHESEHNWAYWRRRPYMGIGPSAHEFDGSSRRWNVAAYADWSEQVMADRSSTSGAERLEMEQVVGEQVYLGLRTVAGVSSAALDDAGIARFVDAGWAIESDGALRLTPTGWLRLDTIAADLTMLRSH